RRMTVQVAAMPPTPMRSTPPVGASRRALRPPGVEEDHRAGAMIVGGDKRGESAGSKQEDGREDIIARRPFPGTAAALPLPGRANTSLVLTADDAATSLLIDCGGDSYSALLRAGFGPDAISDLLITHAHIDHIGALPSLIESFRLGGRTTPLRI